MGQASVHHVVGRHGHGLRVRGSRLGEEGFLTPVGWLYLMLSTAFVLALVAIIAVFVAGSHSTLAQRTADLVAERGAQIGLNILITPPPPGSPGSVLEMLEPERTEVLTEYITDNVLPADAGIWRYLAPLEPGVDVVLAESGTSITVTVTARAGRNGQFVRTRSLTGVAAAANYVAAGRISTTTGLPGGVLPLALDETALASTLPSRAADLVDLRAVPLALGKNAFAVALDDSMTPDEHLRAVSAFLAAENATSPSPAMRTGQRLVLARTTREENAESAVPAEGGEPIRVAEALLSPGILERPVIVPVVSGDVVTAFAVGRLAQSDEQLLFEPIRSAVSPLTGFDPEAPQVPDGMQRNGLALALRPAADVTPTGEFMIGSEEAVG